MHRKNIQIGFQCSTAFPLCYRLPLIGMADSIVRAVQKLYIIVLQVLSRYIHLSQLNITTCNFKSILSSQRVLARAIASHEL